MWECVCVCVCSLFRYNAVAYAWTAFWACRNFVPLFLPLLARTRVCVTCLWNVYFAHLAHIVCRLRPYCHSTLYARTFSRSLVVVEPSFFSFWSGRALESLN
eukprot:Opistho-2@51906